MPKLRHGRRDAGCGTTRIRLRHGNRPPAEPSLAHGFGATGGLTAKVLVQTVNHLTRLNNELAGTSSEGIWGFRTELLELMFKAEGPESVIAKSITDLGISVIAEGKEFLGGLLRSYQRYITSGLREEVSIQRQAQLDVVSDYLEMAHTLLFQEGCHSAAAAVLIGASLEEFLRNWCERLKLPLGKNKPSLETYSLVLRDADLLDKQDGKDITGWSGVRNSAAHGHFNDVDKGSVKIMLLGVNHFMSTHDGKLIGPLAQNAGTS